MLFIDLDGFKAVNDELGHAMGDDLLTEVAERLTESVRKSDMVARLGGDEFTVILNDIKGPDSAMTAAQKMLDTLCQPFRLGMVDRRISAGIGIAFYPADSDGASAILQVVDEAMYKVKRSGTGAIVLATGG